jgi:hypothetical protein
MNSPDIRATDQGAFQMVSHCVVQSSSMGPNGEMVTEKYFDNNAVAKGRDGNTVNIIMLFWGQISER